MQGSAGAADIVVGAKSLKDRVGPVIGAREAERGRAAKDGGGDFIGRVQAGVDDINGLLHLFNDVHSGTFIPGRSNSMRHGAVTLHKYARKGKFF